MNKAENCRQAIAMLESVPEENIRLSLFRLDDRGPPSCNTIACVGGWLPHWPHFAALGILKGRAGEPDLGELLPADIAQRLFGNRSMFNRRSHNEGQGTDKQVAIARFERQLARL